MAFLGGSHGGCEPTRPLTHAELALDTTSSFPATHMLFQSSLPPSAGPRSHLVPFRLPSESPDTPPPPRQAGLLPPRNTLLLVQARSASVAIATWLHALHPHQVCGLVGKRQSVHVRVHWGVGGSVPLAILAESLPFNLPLYSCETLQTVENNFGSLCVSVATSLKSTYPVAVIFFFPPR